MVGITRLHSGQGRAGWSRISMETCACLAFSLPDAVGDQFRVVLTAQLAVRMRRTRFHTRESWAAGSRNFMTAPELTWRVAQRSGIDVDHAFFFPVPGRAESMR